MHFVLNRAKLSNESTLFLVLLIYLVVGLARKGDAASFGISWLSNIDFRRCYITTAKGNFASFPQISGHSHLKPHITALPDNFVHLARSSHEIILPSTTWPQKSSTIENPIYRLIFCNWNIFILLYKRDIISLANYALEKRLFQIKLIQIKLYSWSRVSFCCSIYQFPFSQGSIFR